MVSIITFVLGIIIFSLVVLLRVATVTVSISHPKVVIRMMAIIAISNFDGATDMRNVLSSRVNAKESQICCSWFTGSIAGLSGHIVKTYGFSSNIRDFLV